MLSWPEWSGPELGRPLGHPSSAHPPHKRSPGREDTALHPEWLFGGCGFPSQMVPSTCRWGQGEQGGTWRAEPPGEGLSATASEKGKAAFLSPRQRLLLQAAARLPSQGRLEHQRRGGRRLSQRSPTPFLQWVANCNPITQPLKAPRLAHHFLLPTPLPRGRSFVAPGMDPRFCRLVKGLRMRSPSSPGLARERGHGDGGAVAVGEHGGGGAETSPNTRDTQSHDLSYPLVPQFPHLFKKN